MLKIENRIFNFSHLIFSCYPLQPMCVSVPADYVLLHASKGWLIEAVILFRIKERLILRLFLVVFANIVFPLIDDDELNWGTCALQFDTILKKLCFHITEIIRHQCGSDSFSLQRPPRSLLLSPLLLEEQQQQQQQQMTTTHCHTTTHGTIRPLPSQNSCRAFSQRTSGSQLRRWADWNHHINFVDRSPIKWVYHHLLASQYIPQKS